MGWSARQAATARPGGGGSIGGYGGTGHGRREHSGRSGMAGAARRGGGSARRAVTAGMDSAGVIRTHRRPRRSSLRHLLSSPAVSAACLLFGLAGFLAAAVSLSRAPAEAPRGRCPDSSHPLSVSVAWDRRPGDAAGGATDLPAGLATGSRGRHKVGELRPRTGGRRLGRIDSS
nr:uncharacterized protein LOC109743007 [Aegilops tauschii subsp. strangulata]